MKSGMNFEDADIQKWFSKWAVLYPTQCSEKFQFLQKLRVDLPKFHQADREELKKTVFVSKALDGTRGFLFSLQTNQLEGSFLLNDDVSS
jgi:hypothetical protein